MVISDIDRIMARTRKRTATATPVTPTSTNMTPVDIERAIADGVAAVLERQAEANARNSGSSTPQGGNETPVPRKCTYKDFMSCQPTFYKGTEGVTELAQWFKRTETVFQRSGCTEDCKVTFATGTLLQDALSWWNAVTHTMGMTEAFQLTWAEFKAKILKKYCPRTELRKLEDEFHNLIVKGVDLRTYNRRFLELSALCPTMVPDYEKTLEKYFEGLPRSIEGDVTASNPTTMEVAMTLAQKLLDREVKCNNELKRKLDDKRTTHTNSNNHYNNNYHRNTNPNNNNHKNNNQNRHNHNNCNNQQNPRQEPAKAYATTGSREYVGQKPQCTRCKLRHHGPCTTKCMKCQKVGHQTKDCRSPATGSNLQAMTPTCYSCGEVGHFKNQCTQRKWSPEQCPCESILHGRRRCTPEPGCSYGYIFAQPS